MGTRMESLLHTLMACTHGRARRAARAPPSPLPMRGEREERSAAARSSDREGRRGGAGAPSLGGRGPTRGGLSRAMATNRQNQG